MGRSNAKAIKDYFIEKNCPHITEVEFREETETTVTTGVRCGNPDCPHIISSFTKPKQTDDN